MKTRKFSQVVLGLLLTLLFFCAFVPEVRASGAHPGSQNTKKVYPWFVCHEGTTFDEIEPYKDYLACIAVFGKLSEGFIEKCHKNGIEVYYSVGGDERLIDTREKMKARIHEYVEHCVAEGFDGLDIDYEHLPDAFQDEYSVFLRMASKALHAVGKKFSHCVPYNSFMYDDPDTHLFCKPSVLNETCDLVRVMCYDLYYAPGVDDPQFKNRIDCTGVGPTATYHWSQKVMEYWSSRIDLDKLVMALPAYGNDYTISGPTVRGRQIYSDGPQDVKGRMPEPIWLFYEKLNMYVYDALDGEKHVYYASDGDSTAKLLDLVDRFGITKVGFWHFSSMSKSIWQVTKDWADR